MIKSKPLAILLTTVGVLAFPIIGMSIGFGLAGSDSQNFVIFGIGYLIYLVGSVVGIKHTRFLYGALLGFILMSFGTYQDSQFWQKENESFCQQLRADNYCIETETGFECNKKSSFKTDLVTPQVCQQGLSTEERKVVNKRKRAFQIADAKAKGEKPIEKIADKGKTMGAIDKYRKIVEAILASPEPKALNFEDDLVAIYNCLSEEYENDVKGEWIATNALIGIIKTPEDKVKYQAYCASKGRNITPSITVAALPAGNKNNSCDYLFNH